MGCWATGSLGAGGTAGDGVSGAASPDPASRTTVHLWPTGQPEVWEAIPSEIGGGNGATGAAGASITAFILSPESAMFPTTNFPAFTKNIGTYQLDYTLDYDTTTREAAMWRTIIPAGATWNAASIGIFSRQAVQITGTVGWLVTTLTRGNGQAFDVLGATDTVAATAVAGTAGQVVYQSQTLTSAGWATTSVLLIEITRNVATDTVSEDAKFISAAIELT